MTPNQQTQIHELLDQLRTASAFDAVALAEQLNELCIAARNHEVASSLTNAPITTRLTAVELIGIGALWQLAIDAVYTSNRQTLIARLKALETDYAEVLRRADFGIEPPPVQHVPV